MSFPVQQAESIEVTLQFALLLRDGFANSDQLQGNVSVNSGLVEGQQKDSSGTFLFFNLKSGAQTINVSSTVDTPYYLPAQISVTLPMPSPLWPAYPDVTQANPSLPLGDPGQTAAYKAQRAAATLLPATGYPFPLGATLIRGTVLHNALPLSAATVQLTGGPDPAYVTGSDGQFVLYVSSPPGLPQAATITATHAGMANGTVNVTMIRGLTVSATINM
jgi:hypothetical protein